MAQDPLCLLGSAGAVAVARVHGAVQHGVGVGRRVGRRCIGGDVQLGGPWPHTLLITTREEAPQGSVEPGLGGRRGGLSQGLGACWRS